MNLIVVADIVIIINYYLLLLLYLRWEIVVRCQCTQLSATGAGQKTSNVQQSRWRMTKT